MVKKIDHKCDHNENRKKICAPMCNACRELLKNADSFLVPKIYDDLGGPLPLYPIVAVFKTLNKIVHSCFSVMKVDKSLHV